MNIITNDFLEFGVMSVMNWKVLKLKKERIKLFVVNLKPFNITRVSEKWWQLDNYLVFTQNVLLSRRSLQNLLQNLLQKLLQNVLQKFCKFLEIVFQKLCNMCKKKYFFLVQKFFKNFAIYSNFHTNFRPREEYVTKQAS